MKSIKILVRGGGDLATGTIHRLWSAGFKVLVCECAKPTAIRRQVSVCEAVYDAEVCIEGMQASLVTSLNEAESCWQANKLPVLVDENLDILKEYRPDIVVDAIIAKRNLGTTLDMAPLVIALGPGFVAGEDVHYVVETKRGHNLGRIISQGPAAPNSGIPGNVGGFTKERVIHAPAGGRLKVIQGIGAIVEKGQTIAEICGEDDSTIFVPASLTGIIRGMLRDGFLVPNGMKMADIDPRQEELANCFTISDKARCIAGSVLELVCAYAVRS